MPLLDLPLLADPEVDGCYLAGRTFQQCLAPSPGLTLLLFLRPPGCPFGPALLETLSRTLVARERASADFPVPQILVVIPADLGDVRPFASRWWPASPVVADAQGVLADLFGVPLGRPDQLALTPGAEPAPGMAGDAGQGGRSSSPAGGDPPAGPPAARLSRRASDGPIRGEARRLPASVLLRHSRVRWREVAPHIASRPDWDLLCDLVEAWSPPRARQQGARPGVPWASDLGLRFGLGGGSSSASLN